MLKVKCPQCGSVAIDRCNRDVEVYDQILLDEVTDYVIEGAEEFPIRYFVVRSDESIPPYIQDLASDKLEFTCGDCGYFFDECPSDEAFARFAKDWGLVVWCEP